MTDTSDRYRRLAADFAATIEDVPDDRWSAPSPCEEWTARDVVRHVIETQGLFLGFVGRSPDAGPTVDEDALAAWTTAHRQVQADLEDPDRADAAYDGFAGPSTFAKGVNDFLCTDLVVHRWDLAQAAGLDVTLDREEVARVRAQAESFGDALRGPGAFGPALEPPENADDQTRLLCFLGRRPLG